MIIFFYLLFFICAVDCTVKKYTFPPEFVLYFHGWNSDYHYYNATYYFDLQKNVTREDFHYNYTNGNYTETLRGHFIPFPPKSYWECYWLGDCNVLSIISEMSLWTVSGTFIGQEKVRGITTDHIQTKSFYQGKLVGQSDFWVGNNFHYFFPVQMKAKIERFWLHYTDWLYIEEYYDRMEIRTVDISYYEVPSSWKCHPHEIEIEKKVSFPIKHNLLMQHHLMKSQKTNPFDTCPPGTGKN